MGRAWGYAPACCDKLCKSVPSSTLAFRRLYVTKDGSRTHSPGLALWSFHTMPRARGRRLRQGILAVALAVAIGLARVRVQADEAVMRRCRIGPVAFRERSACTSLVCCESWRERGCALGFMAATFQRKQFPRRCAASSRDKLFSLPGAPRCCARCAVRPAHPPPAGSQQGRTGATLVHRKEKHHG